MEKKPESNEKEKDEKEIMFVMDNLEKCSLCGKDGAYIKEEGIYICNDCFVEQKREIFNLYMNKVNLYPSYEQITNKIYLGNEDTARDKEILNKLNISNILICAEGCEPFFPNEFKYKILYIDDAIDENILSWLKEAFEFIDSSINNIYIHCAMGISRSPTIVISYLMYKKKMKYEEAYDFVKEKRKVISPNSGFQEQLKKFETILEENNYILPDNLGENNNDNDNKNSKEIQNK
jgi:protein-tyrosine phosphatase